MLRHEQVAKREQEHGVKAKLQKSIQDWIVRVGTSRFSSSVKVSSGPVLPKGAFGVQALERRRGNYRIDSIMAAHTSLQQSEAMEGSVDKMNDSRLGFAAVTGQQQKCLSNNQADCAYADTGRPLLQRQWLCSKRFAAELNNECLYDRPRIRCQFRLTQSYTFKLQYYVLSTSNRKREKEIKLPTPSRRG